ncbi:MULTISPECIES: ATP-binding cassette domain-containing protein [unclassified Corynebacterium]|uniref:ATP-binding cassette domain-containing protein n=1 Tax=unclassified Corynebacterium TaxID=2624378 RepID=UPI001EF2A486|nr:ATP-binding cassette domain-containing protein [Corynebacterium sp. ACRPH]MCG7456545.1 ATP-binding cassette domain-containing protein [Corynebacterium sp. ACRPH]
MITVSSLTKAYKGNTVVNDLNFEVSPGIVTGFLGPNGAGKSTTMRMIVGLDEPTKGTARIDGKAYAEYKRPLEKVGTLLDAKWVHPNRSAAAHLRWVAAANGFSKKRVDEVLGIVGLSDVAGRKAGKFSLGMGQRLGLACALLGDPEVLILDEPVNGLDPEGIRWVRDFVRALAREGRTVLISSHLLSEMAQTADHLIVIGKGRLVANQSTHEFIKSTSEVSTVVRTDHIAEMKAALTEESVAFQEGKDLDGRPTLTIPQQESDWIGALAYSYGLRLRELSEKRPSLEDAYLRMTQEHVEYHASVESDKLEAGKAEAKPGKTEAAAKPGKTEAETKPGKPEAAEKAAPKVVPEAAESAGGRHKEKSAKENSEATGNAVRVQKEGDK